MYTPNPTLVTTMSGMYNIQTAQRKYDVSKDIARYIGAGSSAPFTVLLKNLNTKAVIDTTFKILEEQPQPWSDALNGAVTAAATTWIVDNGAYFKVNDLVKNERTGEIVKVTVRATNTLTVIRGLNHRPN